MANYLIVGIHVMNNADNAQENLFMVSVILNVKKDYTVDISVKKIVLNNAQHVIRNAKLDASIHTAIRYVAILVNNV